MQKDALRVWELVWSRASILDDASVETTHEFRRKVIIGKFAATIETVANTANPVIMTASVGWANSAAHQLYDWDATFRDPVSKRFQTAPAGGWTDVESGESWSDAEIAETLLITLGKWLKTNGRYE